ncbi:MAG: hypothetical protein IPO25_14430 [Saprospiraceae bacterium]|nr:hypothetical protein [Saprospiraceae bacterium]
MGSLDSQMYLMMGFTILHAKCTSCHNKNKSKGKLILTAYDDLTEWRRKRYCTDPGSSTSSELYRRITLPGDHKEFMPKEGKTVDRGSSRHNRMVD